MRRFTPLLRVQAAYRLRGALRATTEVDDLVQETWLVAMPRLGDVATRDGRRTPPLVRFLGGILMRIAMNRLRRALREPKRRAHTSTQALRDVLPADSTAILDRLVREERGAAVTTALQTLDEEMRALLILRGVEGHSYSEIALELGRDPDNLRMQFHRALAKLETILPRELVEEMRDAGEEATPPPEGGYQDPDERSPR